MVALASPERFVVGLDISDMAVKKAKQVWLWLVAEQDVNYQLREAVLRIDLLDMLTNFFLFS